MRIYKEGTRIICPACGHRHLLQGKSVGERNENGQMVTAVPLACPSCGKVNKQVLVLRGGPKAGDKGDRVQSTMRWDPDIHAFLTSSSQKYDLSVADLVNEMLRIYVNDPHMTKEIAETIMDREAA